MTKVVIHEAEETGLITVLTGDDIKGQSATHLLFQYGPGSLYAVSDDNRWIVYHKGDTNTHFENANNIPKHIRMHALLED